MSEEINIKKALSGKKVILAIVIGLSLSLGLLIYNLSATQFISVEKDATHYWVDTNSNGQVDESNSDEFVLSNEGNYRKATVGDILREITWSSHSYFWLLAAVIFLCGRDLFYILRIRALTKGDLDWTQGFYVIMIWEFASALTPGVVGGSAIAMFILNREKIALGRSTAIVIVSALMDNLFYILMIPIVFIFISKASLFPEGGVEIEGIFWTGYFIILAVCVILFISVFIYPKLIKNILVFLFRLPFLKKKLQFAIKTGEDIEKTSAIMKTEKPSYWISTFFYTLCAWTCRYLVINCVLMAFLEIDFMTNILILAKQLVMWLFLLVSPTPGGSGIAEYAFGELLTDIGASTLLLTALAIIWRLISYFPYLFIGSFLLPKWLKRTGAYKQENGQV